MTTVRDSHEGERYCAFCGLPLPESFSFGTQADDQEIGYCCSGCRVVAAVENADSAQATHVGDMTRLGLAIFFTMNVMVFTMALWSQNLYAEAAFETRLSAVLQSVFRWASLLFSAPVLWLLGRPIAEGVWQSLTRRTITTDLLVLLGVVAAYGYSVISVVRGAGHVYFEVGAMVLVFVSLGRWLEAKGKRRTNESLDKLVALLPKTVQRLAADGTFQEVPRSDVTTSDVVRVLPGERCPVDGQIVAGRAMIDQQVVTGESKAADKAVGDPVFSGTLNLDGDLRIQVTAADGQETISRLIGQVRRARSTKGRQQLLADKITAWFVPVVCCVAIAAAWHQMDADGVDRGIMTGLAVVLIACPCALGLATPMAVWTALGRAAECGVLFRSGMVMQQLSTIGYACFDKTGTLTSGRPSVDTLLVEKGQSKQEVLRVAGSLASGSNHPLSKTLVRFVASNDESTESVSSGNEESVESIAGKGLRCEMSTYGSVLVGSRRLMDEAGIELPSRLAELLREHVDKQQVFVAWQGRVRGVLLLVEEVRKEAAAALAACRQLGIEAQLLTGDNAVRAQAISQELNISAQGEQLPDDKIKAVEAFSNKGGVAMVGDGLNDAPALAAATVGVALGCGADVSRDAAGVCLLADDLRDFPWAVGLARATDRIVKQNLFWAFSYNCVGIALAATGHLNPIWAALAMAVSSLLVVTNSLRLSHFSKELPGSAEEAAEVIETRGDVCVSKARKVVTTT